MLFLCLLIGFFWIFLTAYFIIRSAAEISNNKLCLLTKILIILIFIIGAPFFLISNTLEEILTILFNRG